MKELGFADSQARVPALLIPIYNVLGDVVLYQARPNVPRIKDGKALKYETPAKARMALDVPPAARPKLGDPSVPLGITEGVRKADSAVSKGMCCVALLGVWNWRGTNGDGGKVALPDWESVALNDRQTYIVFDSDVMLKPEVYGALSRLKPFLESRGAKVAPVYLPAGEGGVKVGLDDYLAAGHTIDDLLACASPTLRALPCDDEEDKAKAEGKTKAGREITFSEAEAWPDVVDGAALLDEMASVLSRFVEFPAGAAELQALWVCHTYASEVFDHTPYLAITSPIKGCGKTTDITVLMGMASRPLQADNVSPAVLFRVIERDHPTVAIDELDRVPKDSEVWQIINSGHSSTGAVLRLVGKDEHEPRAFSTYCPKIVSYIRGSRSPVPDTVEHRSIRVNLQRQSRTERRDKLRSRDLKALVAPIRQRLVRWTQDNSDALAIPPKVPDEARRPSCRLLGAAHRHRQRRRWPVARDGPKPRHHVLGGSGRGGGRGQVRRPAAS